ncbi:MAG: S1/P1 nuclease, partial [Proteobacteria bacterium]|nr:S1/P1 nuclease [Pseudomonadota bacterium]
MIGPAAMTCQPYFPLTSGRALPALLALLALLGAGRALAWGPEGHRIAGLVAEQLLDARSRAALRELVGDESLADVGEWMDRERERLRREWPGSAQWHYDNRPVCEPGAPAERWCPDGQCASRAYASALARLADRGAPRAARRDALRIVVHVLEDLHQPLHAADHDDRGGNELRVRVGRRGHPKPLHAAWDGAFVKRAVRGESEAAFAARLVAEHRASRERLEAGDLA